MVHGSLRHVALDLTGVAVFILFKPRLSKYGLIQNLIILPRLLIYSLPHFVVTGGSIGMSSIVFLSTKRLQ